MMYKLQTQAIDHSTLDDIKIDGNVLPPAAYQQQMLDRKKVIRDKVVQYTNHLFHVVNITGCVDRSFSRDQLFCDPSSPRL